MTSPCVLCHRPTRAPLAHKSCLARNARRSMHFQEERREIAERFVADPDAFAHLVERRTGYTMHQSRVSLPVLTGIEVANAA